MIRLTPVGRVLWAMVVVGVCCVAVSGCATSGEGSAASGVRASDGASSTPAIQMSGGYEVDGQGRLVQPVRSWPELVVDPVMEEESVEGVEAFARYFVAVAERAWNTGDTTELERISATECSYCSNLASSVHETYDSGGWIDGLEYRIKTVDEPVAFPDEKNKYVAMIHFDTSAIAAFDGSELGVIGPVSERFEVHVCRDGERWIVCGAIGGEDGDD